MLPIFQKKKKEGNIGVVLCPTKRNTKLNCSHTAPFAMNYNYKQQKILYYINLYLKKIGGGKDHEFTRNRGCYNNLSRKTQENLGVLGLTHVKIGRLDSQEVQ